MANKYSEFKEKLIGGLTQKNESIFGKFLFQIMHASGKEILLTY